MGRGDKKTKKGKMTIGSYGKVRPRKSNKVAAPVAVVAEKKPKAKAKAKAKKEAK